MKKESFCGKELGFSVAGDRQKTKIELENVDWNRSLIVENVKQLP